MTKSESPPDRPRWLPEDYVPPEGIRLDFSDGYWLYIESEVPPPYEITGKYLFFAEDPLTLFDVVLEEIGIHSFHCAKINAELISGSEYVLCLYFDNDTRRYELRDRYRSRADIKYRWWKSDADTRAGVYSQQFLSGLREPES